MQNRNFILFVILSTAVVMAWPFVAQKIGLLPKPVPRQNQAKQAAKPDPAPPAPVEAKKPDAVAQPDDKPTPADNAKVEMKPASPQPKRDAETIRLGSVADDSPYFVDVTLNSKGAVVESIALNDKRFRELENPQNALKVVGNNKTAHRTFAITIPAIDIELEKSGFDLSQTVWEVAERSPDNDIPNVTSGVTFRYQSPDGGLVVTKQYSLAKSTLSGAELAAERETNPAPYQLRLKIEIANRGAEERTLEYFLQGPAGLPLENADNTSKFRDLKLGFLNADGTLYPNYKRADALVKEHANGAIEEWQTPFKYVGIDVQYFTALLLPADDQLANKYIRTVKPILLDQPARPERTDISLQFESTPLVVAPGKSVEHTYNLFAGPKRQTLLEPIGAEKSLDLGFARSISNLLLHVLHFLYDLGAPYGLAIIGLTIIVRGCMFPLSKKQAAGAKRMKELQPKIQELKKKYGDDREKFARAQMELFRENNYNPLSGCLPVLIQLPIFIGLYQALSNTVDLRMAPFLWVDNLAAPDALFRLPFRIPYLGQDFNLLPIITVGLFLVQQKMFMPPPADEQQEMQFKMMNIMMVFMGAMFYHVPAGLCVYFIASSLWGMGERKLLDWTSGSAPSTPPPTESSSGKIEPPKPVEPRRQGLASALWRKLLESADNAGSQTATRPDENPRANGKKKDRKSRERK